MQAYRYPCRPLNSLPWYCRQISEGDIVVALVDNQNTLKRYFRDDENKKIILHPENKKMKDIIVDECCIQGVACHIIKEL